MPSRKVLSVFPHWPQVVSTVTQTKERQISNVIKIWYSKRELVKRVHETKRKALKHVTLDTVQLQDNGNTATTVVTYPISINKPWRVLPNSERKQTGKWSPSRSVPTVSSEDTSGIIGNVNDHHAIRVHESVTQSFSYQFIFRAQW
jgi:hypothetical protein